MVKSFLEILMGEPPVKIEQTVGMFDQDGGGSSKGFGIVAKEDIPANTEIRVLYRALVKIPGDKQVMYLKWYYSLIKNIAA